MLANAVVRSTVPDRGSAAALLECASAPPPPATGLCELLVCEPAAREAAAAVERPAADCPLEEHPATSTPRAVAAAAALARVITFCGPSPRQHRPIE